MADFKSLNEAFKVGTARLHLNSPSGASPMYLITDKDGNTEPVAGTWASGVKSDREGLFADDPVAPACPQGKTIAPCVLIIRNTISPDSERFLKARGLDPEAEADPKSKNRNTELSNMEKNVMMAASCIVDFENIPMFDEKTGDTGVMPFTEENAIQLMRDHDIAITQIRLFVTDKKKFESLSVTG